MTIPNIESKEFEYDLPHEKIAQFPLANRDESKLLISENDTYSSDIYKNISTHIPSNSLMIFNDSKVIPARILHVKETGAIIEIFCLEPIKITPTEALLQSKLTNWTCMIGGLKKWNTDLPLQWKIDEHIKLEAHFIKKNEQGFEIQFRWNSLDTNFAGILEQLGQMPIPPYLLRKADDSDTTRYQTMYAKKEGSVAAPTAGLHFTKHIFDSLKNKNIEVAFTTLHVGAGTFKPVYSKHIHEHEMHAEWIEVSLELIEKIYNAKHIVSVGTTSLRTMESLYWFAFEAMSTDTLFNNNYILQQFTPYKHENNFDKSELLAWLILKMKNNNKTQLFFRTQLMILPFYKIRMANQLVTNFHQPKSTLLMLVAACANNQWKSLYQYALENEFRFLSYGDGCLININQ